MIIHRYYQTIKQLGRRLGLKFTLLLTILTVMTLIAIAAGQPFQAQNVDPDSPPPLLLTDEQEAYQLGSHMEILEDTERRWTIEDIASPEFARRFAPSGVDELRIGFGDSVYWVRIQLHNSSHRSEWWLEHADAMIWYLDLYSPHPDGSGFKRTQTGALRPFATQDISTLTYVFPLSIPPQSTQTLYLRYEHSRSTKLPLHLWSPAAFASQSQLKMWQLVTWFAIWLFLLSSLLLFWYRLRSQHMLYLALTAAAILANNILEKGIGRQYFWPNLELGIWYRSLNLVVAVILFFSFIRFTTLFLDTKQQYPKWHKVLQGLMILMLLVMIQIPFVADHIVTQEMSFLYVFSFLALIALGIWAWILAYHRTWRSVVTSLLFISFLMVAILAILGDSGIFSSQARSEQLDFLGFIIFISFISMVIADRVAVALQRQQEAQRKQEEISAALQKANEELEQRVLDRTRELSVLYDVTSVASQALDLKTTMAQCLDRVVEVMQGNVGTIHLVDEADQILHLATTQGFRSDALAEFDILPAGTGLTGQVLEQGEILIVPDMANDPRTLPVTSLNDLQSYVGIPIRASGSILGVLSIARKRGQPMFSVEEVALLGSIADQVGVVVESAKLREQAEQAAVVEERTRLARDLHDSVTQLMYSINLFAGVGQKAYRLGDVERMNRSLVDLTETTQQAFKEMRLLVYELRPPALEQEDLVGALRHRLERVEQRANIETDFQVDNSGIALPDSVEEELYYIAEEALNNALKHAAATAVTVRLDAGVDQIELGISDNGRGFEPDTSRRNGGLGLISMQERVEKLGGKLTVISAPGAGTTVKAILDRGGSNGQ